MADYLSADLDGSSDNTLDNDAVAKSLLGNQKPAITWQDIVNMAKQQGLSQAQSSAPGSPLFGGYKQNVPIAQIQPIPDTEDKKNDQGLSQGIDAILKAYGGSSGGASFTGAGVGTPIT